MDNHFRVQFSKRMGFSSKFPTDDFHNWVAQGQVQQCDIKAAVEMNLTSKGTRHFRNVSQQELDTRSQVFLHHPLDPTKELKKRKFLKGGSVFWLPSHTNARKHSYSTDKHGRWSAIRLTAATCELVIIITYKVCNSTITGETTTIAAREQNSLLKQGHPDALNVRIAFLSDLGKFLQDERKEEREIHFMADGNTPNNHTEFVEFFKQYDMTDIAPAHASPSCTRSNPSSPPTEIIFGSRLFEEAITGFGMYPF